MTAAGSSSISLAPMGTQNPTEPMGSASQQTARLTYLVDETLKNLEKVEKQIELIQKNLDSQQVVEILTDLRDSKQFPALIDSMAKRLDRIFKITLPPVQSNWYLNSYSAEAYQTLKKSIDWILYPILDIDLGGNLNKPNYIPLFSHLKPTNYPYSFKYLQSIDKHPLFNPIEWASAVSYSPSFNILWSAILNCGSVDRSNLVEVLEKLYAFYRFPLTTEAYEKDPEGYFNKLKNILDQCYQNLDRPEPPEDLKKRLADTYQQLLGRHPPGTFKKIDNVVEHVIDLAERSRRGAYSFLCSLYSGVKPEIDKALAVADQTTDIQPLRFAMDFLSPKERDAQCSAALELRCKHPIFSPSNGILHPNYEKIVIITLLGGGAIFSANSRVAPHIHPWLVEYNDNVVRAVRGNLNILPELIKTVIDYISFVPPIQQPFVFGAQN